MQKEALENNDERQLLVFRLLNQELGLDISHVREVLKPGEVHPLVQAPDFIEGVINLRNHVIAVMDLRKRFSLAPANDRSDIRIVICTLKTFVVGLIVDGVSEVLRVPKADIQPTPGIISAQMKDSCFAGIAKVGERVIAIVDLEKLLTNEEITNLSLLKK